MNDSPVAGQAKGPRGWAVWRFESARLASNPLLPCLALLALWYVWRFEPFYRVAVGSQDQVGFSLQATSDLWGSVTGHAKNQGRVYFLFTTLIDLWLAARPDRTLPSVINILVFALSPWGFALTVFRQPSHQLLYGWLFASVAWAGFYHMPPTAYPTTIHLPLLLCPIAACAVRWRSRSAQPGFLGTQLLFGVLAFVSFFQYEAGAALAACLLGWVVYSEPNRRLQRALCWALGAALAAYGTLYLGWRFSHPPTYNGVQVGTLTVWNVLRVAIAYTVGGLPFSAGYRVDIDLRWGDSRVGEKLFRFYATDPYAFGVLALLLTLFALLSLARLYGLGRPPSAGRFGAAGRYAPWVFVVLCLLLINGPLGLSAKYQKWVVGLDETYLTSQVALYPLVLAGTLLGIEAQERLRVRGVPLAFFALLASVAWLSLGIRAHNVEVTDRQRANVARWEGLTALAAYTSYVPQESVVAPDFFYSVFTGEPNWSKYWRSYMRQRFGGTLKFYARRPPGMDAAPLVRLHRFENGRLRALTVQTPDALAIVAAPDNLPALVSAGDGVGVGLDWQEAERLLPSQYLALTLSDESLVGLDKHIEPVWLLPSGGLSAP